MLRVLFSSVESTEQEWAKEIPSHYNRTTFETLRWRHHGLPQDKTLHGHPKALVDVSKIPKKVFNKHVVYSIHRPFTDFCRSHGESDYQAFQKFPVAANHYLGSWERYNARDDKRRSWQVRLFTVVLFYGSTFIGKCFLTFHLFLLDSVRSTAKKQLSAEAKMIGHKVG
jgi:hypothetical protein